MDGWMVSKQCLLSNAKECLKSPSQLSLTGFSLQLCCNSREGSVWWEWLHCVLSPLLFILYTNICCSSREDRFILKYADSSVIVNETGHGPVAQDFVDWCDRSFLQMNIWKTKDMLIGFRKLSRANELTIIKGQTVECAKNYKYLGIIIDNKLNFEANCEAVPKKGNQRLCCLRKLSSLHIDSKMLTMVYLCFIESVISFSLLSWFSNLCLENKNSLNQIVRWQTG